MNVIERHLCNIAAFILCNTILLNIYFVINRLGILKSRYNCCYGHKQRGLSYVAGSCFRCFRSRISGYQRTKTEVSQEGQEPKIKLKDQKFLFSLNQENKKRFQEWLN